jgi:phosphatidylglycerophosphate synthase
MIVLDEIKNIIKSNSIHKPNEISLLLVISRIISPPFVYLLAKWRVNPIHINYINFILVISALLSFAFFSYYTVTIMLLMLWQFIDTLDGGLARARNIVNNYGGFVDYLTGMIVITFLPISVAVAASNQMHNDLLYNFTIFVHVSPTLILIIGGLSSISAIFSRFINHTVKIRFNENNALKLIYGLDITSVFKIVIINIENVGGVQLIVLLIMGLFDFLHIYVIIYGIINILTMTYVLVNSLFSYRGHSKYLQEKGK